MNAMETLKLLVTIATKPLPEALLIQMYVAIWYH